MTASEEQLNTEQPSAAESNNNNNEKSVKIEIEKQALPPVPEDGSMQQPTEEMKVEVKMEDSSVAVPMEEKESVENK